MIKQSTVIKRMIKDGWKPVTTIAVTIGAIMFASVQAEKAFGVSSDAVYFGLVALWFGLTGLKWMYEWKKSEIKWEQEKMMRDLERKHP